MAALDFERLDDFRGFSPRTADSFTVTFGRDVNLDGNSSDRANTGNSHLDPKRPRNDVTWPGSRH